jgi:predicted glycosyltransferase
LRVFVSPLDWGLGHAARCISVIRRLLDANVEVIAGAEGGHLAFLKEHFPTIEYIEFPGYRISYSAKLPVGIKVLLQLPQMISAIKNEHELLAELIKTKKLDAVISDNRYGLWNENIPSVIITHQLNIQAPAGNNLLNTIAHKYINRFDECWISDYEGKENLTGILSHPIPEGINAKYIGPLSRFAFLNDQPQTPKGALGSAIQSPFRGLGPEEIINYDLLVTLSGPEPQRSLLEEMVLKQLKELPSLRTLIIQGLPGGAKSSSLTHREEGHIEIVPHLGDVAFLEKLRCSDIVLSRPGYSTIMDMDTIGWKKAIFIPTPGQTEHEYLGKLMQEKGLAITYNQKGFSLNEAIEKAKQLKPVKPNYNKENFKAVVEDWLKRISSQQVI